MGQAIETLSAKSVELAGVVLSPGAVTRVEELAGRLDEFPRLSDLVVALTRERPADARAC
jgi:hypothetical protein